jgi:hypothetical protein
VQRLVALSGTTFALLTFVVHDAMREHLRELRDDLANEQQLQLQRQDALEIKYNISSLQNELTNRILELKTKDESDSQKLETARMERDYTTLKAIQSDAANFELLLEECSTLMSKLHGKWVDAQKKTLESLKWNCRCSKEFAELLLFTRLMGGSLKPGTVFDGTHYWADYGHSPLPKLLGLDLNWFGNAAAAAQIEPLISDVSGRMGLDKREINDFSGAVESQISKSISSYESWYNSFTYISYALYALIFAFNAWVVKFTTDTPETPD